ncbi:hypothetical protein L842_5567, partial [Mycobacterium intracellulare MIN_052511_1280]
MTSKISAISRRSRRDDNQILLSRIDLIAER